MLFFKSFYPVIQGSLCGLTGAVRSAFSSRDLCQLFIIPFRDLLIQGFDRSILLMFLLPVSPFLT